MDRRTFIENAVAGTIFAVLGGSASGAAASGEITGFVRCGKRPASGVIVSDGLNCVKTRADGSYALPVREGARFVFATAPSGWGPLASVLSFPERWGRYDFTFQPNPQTAKKGCRFIHISDSEIGGVGEDERNLAANVRRIAEEADVAFIVHTGDICRRRGMLAHHQLMTTDTMGRDMIYAIGNHDMESGPYGEMMFETIFGPSWFSFEAGGVHFVVLPVPFGDFRPSFDMNLVADWLRNDLTLVPRDRPVVVLSHYLTNWSDPEKVGFVVGEGTHALDLRKACNFVGFVYGHTHHNRFCRRGKTAFVCTANPQKGGIDLSPATVRVVDVSADGTLTSTSHYGYQSEWTHPKPTSAVRWETRLDGPVLYASPLVCENWIFVGTLDDDGKGTGGVTALDARTGRVLWTCRTETSVRGTLAVCGGLVLAQDADYHVYGIRSADGSLAWKMRFPKTAGTETSVLSNGVAVDERLNLAFVGSATCRTALSVKDGTVVWRSPVECGGEAGCDAPGVGEGKVVTLANWWGAYCTDAATGREIWKVRRGPCYFPAAQPLVRNGKVLVTAQKSFLELDLATGKTLRERKFSCSLQVASRVVEAGGLYLFGSVTDGLIALNRETLEVAWKGAVGPALVPASPYSQLPQRCLGTVPVIFGDRVCAAAADGAVHFWSLADGAELGEVKTGAPYLASAARCETDVVVADLSGWVRRVACKEMK